MEHMNLFSCEHVVNSPKMRKTRNRCSWKEEDINGIRVSCLVLFKHDYDMKVVTHTKYFATLVQRKLKRSALIVTCMA